MNRVARFAILLGTLALVPPGSGCGTEDPDGDACASDADCRPRDEVDLDLQDDVIAAHACEAACPWEAARLREVACPWEEGDWHYCRDCGPCPEGAGDCDTDAECEAGLVCVQRAGEVDVCEADAGPGPTVYKLSVLQGRYAGGLPCPSEPSSFDGIVENLNTFYTAVSGDRIAFELHSRTESPVLLDESTRVCDSMRTAQIQLQEKARAAGVDLENADFIINMFSDGPCNLPGYRDVHNADMGGTNSRFFTCDLPLFALRHEIGHNLGMAHSHVTRITESFASELASTFPESCMPEDPEDPPTACYDLDPLDIMGSGKLDIARGLSPPHLLLLGWVRDPNWAAATTGTRHAIHDYFLERERDNLLFVLVDSKAVDFSCDEDPDCPMIDCHIVASFTLGFVILHQICLDPEKYRGTELLDQLEPGQAYADNGNRIVFEDVSGSRAVVRIEAN
jgi:hypothetical protein